MLGAIIGSLVSSIYDFGNAKSEDSEWSCGMDVVLTLGYQDILQENLISSSQFIISAIETIVNWEKDYTKIDDYKRNFYLDWFLERFKYQDVCPIDHYLTTVSLCGHAAKTLDDAIKTTEDILESSRKPDEEIAAAQITAAVIYKAKLFSPKKEIISFAEKYIQDIKWCFGDDVVRYDRKPSCLALIPHAIRIFNDSKNFDDAIRRAVKYDNYNTPLAVIVGEIAEAYYGIPDEIRKMTSKYLFGKLTEIFDKY